MNYLLFIPNDLFFLFLFFFGVYTFSLGIPCERLRHQMIWIAKFILDEFVKGYVPLLVQKYCRGLGK